MYALRPRRPRGNFAAPRAALLAAALTLALLGVPTEASAAPDAAYYAPHSVTFEPPELDSRSLLSNGIFGVDQRAQVTQTDTHPWAVTVLVVAEFPSGAYMSCSGFIAGPKTVGTAGHCIYAHDEGGWATRTVIVPGANGGAEPFGRTWGTNGHSVAGWILHEDDGFDLGAITVADDLSFIGGFGMHAATDAELLTYDVGVSGYPGDKPFGTMWYSAGRITSTSQTNVYYQIDVTHGNSGGPIWLRNASDEYYVVGIVTAGNAFTNIGVRINQQVLSHFTTWRNEAVSGAAPPAATPGPTTPPPATSTAPFTTYGTGLFPGQTIQAAIGGIVCGTAIADGDGNWLLQIASDAPCKPSPGAQVTFTLDGQPTTATETWQPGGAPSDAARGVRLVVGAPPSGVAAAGNPGAFAGHIAASGTSLVLHGGGSIEQFVADAAAVGAVSVSLSVEGRLLTFVVGAPEFVNAGFRTALGAGVPAATPVLLRT